MRRLSMAETALAACAGLSSVDVAAAEARLRHVYPDREPVTILTTGRAVLFVIGDRGPSYGPADETLLVWGRPVGAQGDATPDELIGALSAPDERARDLAGTFVLVRVSATGVRLVSSANVVRTLCTASCGQRTAVATKALAALAAVGASAEIDPEVVPEFVLFSSVLGDREALHGVTALDDAQVADLGATQIDIRSWWPFSSRFSPGPRTDEFDLRAELSDVTRRVARARGARLALTGGVDSTLVAGCLTPEGGSPELLAAFTMGSPSDPDAIAAGAVAEGLGLSHEVVPTRTEPDLDAIVSQSGWAEGAEPARNLATGLTEPRDPPELWVGGWGGEAGRAFYWGRHEPVRDPVDHMSGRAKGMAEPAREGVRAHFELDLGALASIRPDPPDVLDLFYLRNRMRKWLGRRLPDGVAGFVPAFLEPPVARVLVNARTEDRRSGALFDRALALGNPDPRSLIPTAVTPLRPGLLPVRVARRLLRRRPDIAFDWPVLADALDHLEPSLDIVVDTVGEEWWERRLGDAVHPRGANARRQLWNAVTVAGLAAWMSAHREACASINAP